jgi:Flp pilus assembly protein TadG
MVRDRSLPRNRQSAMSMKRYLSLGCLREDRGISAIEFALVAPFLCTFVLGVVDLGFGFQAKMAVTQAAQAGTYYAMLKGYDSSAIQTVVANATGTSGITAPSAAQSCGCPSGTAVTTAPCSSTCANGQTSGTYVSVSAQYQYSSILAYPGLPRPMTLSATSMVRIK